MGFAYYPPAGVAAESDPTALKIAQNLADLNNAATARSNLGLKDLAEEERANLREVPAASMAADGDVLAADGLGGYAWEAPAAAGGNWVRETVSASMGAPEFQTGQNYDLTVVAGGPGPYYVESALITQIGGTSADPIDDTFSRFNIFRNPGRTDVYVGGQSLYLGDVPATVPLGVIGHDSAGNDSLYVRFTDGEIGTGETVQFQVFLTIRRPAGITDNT